MTHSGVPSAGPYDPGAHGRHADAFVAPNNLLSVPTPHARHVATLVAPTAPLHRPGAHGAHTPTPVRFPYVPRLQGRHQSIELAPGRSL